MNSPVIPDRCPECRSGVELVTLSATQYKCETRVLVSGEVIQPPKCIRNQRDQLAQRVRILEARLANRDEAAACAVIQDARRGES